MTYINNSTYSLHNGTVNSKSYMLKETFKLFKLNTVFPFYGVLLGQKKNVLFPETSNFLGGVVGMRNFFFVNFFFLKILYDCR